SGNSAAFDGGGLTSAFDGTTVELKNTIVAKQVKGPDCSGHTTSRGYNLDSDETCGLSGPGDQPGADPLLGPLQNKGGPTWTRALGSLSPAIDAIPVGTNGCGDPGETDQRGIPRPHGIGCDIGAFEAQASKRFLTTLNPARVWIGLKSSDDVGLRLDV